MEDWKTNKLGELLTQRKEQIVIQPESEYSLVTITNKGEVRLREKKKGALIKSQKGYVTKAGDFIYSRLSVHNGAFGIVPEELEDALITNEMPCFQIDTTQVHPKILLDLLGMPEFHWKLNQLTKGMGRVRIKESMILDLNVSFPVPSKQQLFVDKIDTLKNHRFALSSVLTHQQTLLKKLRQQILQEAIEGKLTAQWRKENPDTEPASVLLKRIKAEKAQLVKEKKIKKQKALPPITEEEKPFELPDGWEWCRLGDLISISSGDGLTSYEMKVGNIPVFGGNGITGYHDSYNTKERTVTIGRVGAHCGAVHLTPKLAWITDNCFKVYYSKSDINRDFLILHLKNLNLGQASFKSAQPVISGARIYPLITHLPPLPEQKIIVTKVEKFLALCDQMETRITQNQAHADQLMQAVLKEAFDPDGQERGRKQPLQSKEV